MIILSKIFVYPIKSLPGIDLSQATISAGGCLSNDRRWAISDSNGGLLSAKKNRCLFGITPSYNLEAEKVCFEDEKGGIEGFQLDDVGALSAYLSDILSQPVRLIEDKQQGFPDDLNAAGPTVVATESLQQVASWYPGLSLDEIRARFRINLEVSHAPAFWEDQLFSADGEIKTLFIGSVAIQAINPCARCSVPMKNPKSGKSYAGFYQTFISQREKTRPNWTDPACFDHWYRLSVNTRICADLAGQHLNLGDKVTLNPL